MLELGWWPCLRAVLGFGVPSFHSFNPKPLLNCAVAQRIKELADLKTKKNSKSRKKRKQNTEDEGKGRHSVQGARGRDCTGLRWVGMPSCAESDC